MEPDRNDHSDELIQPDNVTEVCARGGARVRVRAGLLCSETFVRMRYAAETVSCGCLGFVLLLAEPPPENSSRTREPLLRD